MKRKNSLETEVRVDRIMGVNRMTLQEEDGGIC